ncbi:MAG: radical SAM protein [Pseudomonadota bacterium]
MNWATNLFDFYFRTKVLRRKMPLLASFKLTYRCNLACRACPFHQRANEPDAHITRDKAIHALDALKKTGCRIVVFEGGEPFLWQDGDYSLKDLICYAKKHFLRVAVTTNGTFPLAVPADVVWVSLDGLRQTQDRLRSSSFDRIWENLKAATRTKVLIHLTLNRENRHELEALLEKLKEVPAVRGMTVQFFYPYGQGEEDLRLLPSERKAAIETAIALKGRGYPIMNSARSLRAMLENTWDCAEDILINVDPDGTITRGCYAKRRGAIQCAECGFTAVAEASGALKLHPGAILSGWRTFIAG